MPFQRHKIQTFSREACPQMPWFRYVLSQNLGVREYSEHVLRGPWMKKCWETLA